ncbi:uncharacterized protein LOC142623208 isoform X1 [Castanea sativa]|uniref:uncharacterized protein LOC142623208 isoform X1 n=1 Tax=Castanea sativa TaxID=21020 RepID=UPI003F652423
MASVLNRSLATASLASLPSSSSFLLRNSNRNRVLNLTTAFVPQNGLRKHFSSSGLKWKYERRNHRFALRCEATAVAKKEAADTSGEKFENQAEIDKRAYTGKPIITLPAIYLFVSFSFTFSSLHYYDHYIVSTRLCKVVTNSCEDARQSIRRARQKAMDTAKKLYSHAPKDDVKKIGEGSEF